MSKVDLDPAAVHRRQSAFFTILHVVYKCMHGHITRENAQTTQYVLAENAPSALGRGAALFTCFPLKFFEMPGRCESHPKTPSMPLSSESSPMSWNWRPASDSMGGLVSFLGCMHVHMSSMVEV